MILLIIFKISNFYLSNLELGQPKPLILVEHKWSNIKNIKILNKIIKSHSIPLHSNKFQPISLMLLKINSSHSLSFHLNSITINKITTLLSKSKMMIFVSDYYFVTKSLKTDHHATLFIYFAI